MSASPRPPPSAAYRFRPMRADGVAMVGIWQMAPHVQAWQDDEAITPADGESALGALDMLGGGHGSAFVRAFADALLTAGVPRVITNPALANAHAIAAYAKAGFRREREVSTPDGRALLMLRDGLRDGLP